LALHPFRVLARTPLECFVVRSSMGHARIGARDLARRTENSPLDVKNLKTRNCSLQNQNGSSKGSFAYNSELLDGAFRVHKAGKDFSKGKRLIFTICNNTVPSL